MSGNNFVGGYTKDYDPYQTTSGFAFRNPSEVRNREEEKQGNCSKNSDARDQSGSVGTPVLETNLDVEGPKESATSVPNKTLFLEENATAQTPKLYSITAESDDNKGETNDLNKNASSPFSESRASQSDNEFSSTEKPKFCEETESNSQFREHLFPQITGPPLQKEKVTEQEQVPMDTESQEIPEHRSLLPGSASSSTRTTSFQQNDYRDTRESPDTTSYTPGSQSPPPDYPEEPTYEFVRRSSQVYDDDEENHFEPESSVPEYSTITPDLQYKVDNFPQKTSVPFFIWRQAHASGNGANNVSKNHWNWRDPLYVRLPHSPLNINKGEGGDGNRKWDTIVKQLRRLKWACENNKIEANFAREVGTVIGKYFPESCEKTNFGMLARPELEEELLATLPIIVDLALKLPNLLAEPIPVLRVGESRTINLTRKLCACLLANCFFCTFPPANPEYQQPDFNFYRLYNDTQTNRCEKKQEKLKCLLNYFQVINKMEEPFLSEIVSFERRCVRNPADWENSDKPLCEVKVEPHHKIEDADGMLQIDFANKYIGGGVLNDGCVMEEIRFSISPELLVSRIFTEKMEDEEAVIITGSQIYSKYTGYANTFMYTGPLEFEPRERSLDNLGRTFAQIAAIDAVNFSRFDSDNQYQRAFINRELHKCYVAYIHGKKVITPVATGNWGCGAFNGNPELKFLLQWIAASHQERPILQYHTVGDRHQSQRILEISDLLQRKKLAVGTLYQTVTKFHKEMYNSRFGGSLFNYLHHKFGNDDPNGRFERGRNEAGRHGHKHQQQQGGFWSHFSWSGNGKR